MSKLFSLIKGAGIGAGLMYLLDPDLGNRRQAKLRDRFMSSVSQFGDSVDVAWRDLCHRANGMAAEAIGLLSDGSVPDEVLAERVRSKIGRHVSHPRAIDVDVADGLVALAGPVLMSEMEGLLSAVMSVRGVRRVENHLEPHAVAGDISGLQGGRANRVQRRSLGKAKTTPASRLLTAMAGGALVAYGTTKRFPVACILGTIGLGLIVRAVADLERMRHGGPTLPQPRRSQRPKQAEADVIATRDEEPAAPEVTPAVSYDL
jgi:hypothetical protein